MTEKREDDRLFRKDDHDPGGSSWLWVVLLGIMTLHLILGFYCGACWGR
jgi:hypothetical protein